MMVVTAFDNNACKQQVYNINHVIAQKDSRTCAVYFIDRYSYELHTSWGCSAMEPSLKKNQTGKKDRKKYIRLTFHNGPALRLIRMIQESQKRRRDHYKR